MNADKNVSTSVVKDNVLCKGYSVVVVFYWILPDCDRDEWFTPYTHLGLLISVM